MPPDSCTQLKTEPQSSGSCFKLRPIFSRFADFTTCLNLPIPLHPSQGNQPGSPGLYGRASRIHHSILLLFKHNPSLFFDTLLTF